MSASPPPSSAPSTGTADDMDLNIDHYTLDDLQALLELPSAFSLSQLHAHVDQAVASAPQWLADDDAASTAPHDASARADEVRAFFGEARDRLHAAWIQRQVGNAGGYGEATRPRDVAAAAVVAVAPQRGIQTHRDPTDLAACVAADAAAAPGYVVADLQRRETSLNMARTTTDINVNIDTRFRPQYRTTSASNYLYTPPQDFTNVVAMTLRALDLPLSFYAVSAARQNHALYLTVNDGDGVVLTIPDGNYTPAGAVAALNAALAALGDALYTQLEFTYLASADGSGSGKIQFGVVAEPNTAPDPVVESFVLSLVSPAVRAQFLASTALCAPTGPCDEPVDVDAEAAARGEQALAAQKLPGTLGWMLGFRAAQYIVPAGSDPLAVVSEGLADLRGPRYLFLSVDDQLAGQTTQFYGMLNESVINKPILARISLPPHPTDAARAALSLSQNDLALVTSPRVYRGPSRLRAMRIELLDEYGHPVDLNFMDYSFCLSLTRLEPTVPAPGGDAMAVPRSFTPAMLPSGAASTAW